MKETKKFKKEKGITLVALIITIIIMLILVGVSINILIKSDLLGAAQRAADKTRTAYNKEGTMGEIEIGGEKYNSVDEYINQSQCTHEWGEWEIIKAANCSETGLKRRTCTKCGKVEEEEIAKNASHIIADGKCTKCGGTYELQIGATIDYKEYIDPSTGKAFTEMPSYTSLKTTRGTTDPSDDSDTTYTIAEPGEGETGIEWIVIGEEDGKIKIKTKNIVQPSTGGYTYNGFKYLRFRGQAGYTNFVNELNSIGTIYGKGKYAESGRSMKLEDLGYGELTRKASYIYAKHSDGKIYRYAATATAGDIANEKSTTVGSYSTFEYMAMDGDSTLKEGDEGAYEWKSLSNAGDNATMYDYIYTGRQTLSNAIASTDTDYWLASRYLSCASSFVTFKVHTGTADGWVMRGPNFQDSNGGTAATWKGVCPVVYLQAGIQLQYDAATNSYTISE